ncbi:MAG: hypothetical protein ABI360_10200 [Allobranchiibius sp.]
MTGSADDRDAEPTLLGGEMTDVRDGVEAPNALTTWVAATLDLVAGSVLLIGPRAALLADVLGDRATVLVRGTVDAQRLASQGVQVLCGGPDRLGPDTYDTVVLLDPPERVLTPDSPGLGQWELVELANTHSSDRLISFVPNALALQRMSGPQYSTGPGGFDDESWWVGTPGYDARPLVHTDLPEAPSWLVLGDTAVVPVDTLADPLTMTTLKAALPTHEGWLDAIRAEALPQLATGWLLVRSSDQPPSGAVVAPSLQQPVSGSGCAASRAGSTAAGEPLEVGIASALRRGDRAQLGALVALYAAYLQTVAGNCSQVSLSAAPRNLVVTADGSLTPRVAHNDKDTVATAVCFAHGLLDLSTLVSGTADHPFAPECDAAALARELGEFSDQLVPEANEWEQASTLHASGDLPVRRSRRGEEGRPSKGETRVLALEEELRERQGKITYLQALAGRQERRIRAFEHAIATEHGPRARQVLFVMTAPTTRLVQAARDRLRRGPGRG